MNVDQVVIELKAKYPGKEIIFDDPVNPSEIIVELEPTRDHPDRSLALAVVGKSKPHYHKTTTEIYEVIKGELKLTIDGKTFTLNPGEKMTIKPKSVHSAAGDETWFLTHSTPGWNFEDHIINYAKT